MRTSGFLTVHMEGMAAALFSGSRPVYPTFYLFNILFSAVDSFYRLARAEWSKTHGNNHGRM